MIDSSLNNRSGLGMLIEKTVTVTAATFDFTRRIWQWCAESVYLQRKSAIKIAEEEVSQIPEYQIESRCTNLSQMLEQRPELLY